MYKLDSNTATLVCLYHDKDINIKVYDIFNLLTINSKEAKCSIELSSPPQNFKPCKSMICGAFLLIAEGKIELLINYAVFLGQKMVLIVSV
jgi:hypothetical protein